MPFLQLQYESLSLEAKLEQLLGVLQLSVANDPSLVEKEKQLSAILLRRAVTSETFSTDFYSNPQCRDIFRQRLLTIFKNQSDPVHGFFT